jgi:membrane protein YdbS with pleckstrin-like domain
LHIFRAVTERGLAIFLVIAVAIFALFIWLGVWWVAIPIVLLILPGPFVTPGILQKLGSKRSGAQFQKTVRPQHVAFTEDDEKTLT